MRGEKLMSLTEAARWLEEELGLKRHRLTVHAWLYYGRNGVQLEAVSVAGVWHTTAGALRRFLSNCTRQHSAETGCDVPELKL